MKGERCRHYSEHLRAFRDMSDFAHYYKGVTRWYCPVCGVQWYEETATGEQVEFTEPWEEENDGPTNK